MSGHRASSRVGFTLIELIASAVLASMLMIALMSIAWSASRDLRQTRKDERSNHPTTLLMERLRFDLLNARGMVPSRQSLTLHGFIARDPSSQQPTWTEGRVVYRISGTRNGPVLIREQADRRDVMWVGVGGITIDGMDSTDPDDALMALPEAGGLPPVPAKFRMTIVDPEGRPLWREVIHHHAL